MDVKTREKRISSEYSPKKQMTVKNIHHPNKNKQKMKNLGKPVVLGVQWKYHTDHDKAGYSHPILSPPPCLFIENERERE